MMVYQTYQLTLEPHKKTFNMCHHLLVLEVLHKRDCCSVAKWHLVNHVGVTYHDVPGCSKKEWFLRLIMRNIPSMYHPVTTTINFLNIRTRNLKNRMCQLDGLRVQHQVPFLRFILVTLAPSHTVT